MIELLAPLGLAALAALGIPLLIHLVRRSDRQLVSFAAMRFLSERSHPRKELRIHERLLLALRLLLIASLAVLLAMPVWRSAGKPETPWVVLAPGIDVATAQAAVNVPQAQWHWLSPGFPSIEVLLSTADQTPVASLVRQLDADLPAMTSLTLVVPEELDGLDAERLRLGRTVDWRVLPGPTPAPAAVTEAAKPLRLAVRHDAGGTAELPVVRALAAAWQADGMSVNLDIAPLDTPLPAQLDWLIWLGPTPPPAVDEWLRHGGRALVSRQPQAAGDVVLIDDDGNVVLRERSVGTGRSLSAAGPLLASAMPAVQAAAFPQQLRSLLAAPLLAPDRALAASVAPLRRDVKVSGPVQSLELYLAVCAALLFLAERIWATRRRTAA